jgi:hypothetical protein
VADVPELPLDPLADAPEVLFPEVPLVLALAESPPELPVDADSPVEPPEPAGCFRSEQPASRNTNPRHIHDCPFTNTMGSRYQSVRETDNDAPRCKAPRQPALTWFGARQAAPRIGR